MWSKSGTKVLTSTPALGSAVARYRPTFYLLDLDKEGDYTHPLAARVGTESVPRQGRPTSRNVDGFYLYVLYVSWKGSLTH